MAESVTKRMTKRRTKPGDKSGDKSADEPETRGRTPRLYFSKSGVGKTLKDWAQHAGLRPACVRNRLTRGWTLDEAVGLKSRDQQNRLVQPDLTGPSMTNAQFLAWVRHHGYSHRTFGYRMLYEELCLSSAATSRMLNNRPIPADVVRLCQCIDLLDETATIPATATAIDLARSTLVKHSGIKILLPKNIGYHAWNILRLNRLCTLAAAVQTLASSPCVALAEHSEKARRMIQSWSAPSASQIPDDNG